MTAMFLETQLQMRTQRGILRTLPHVQGLTDLTSNDYFGFAKSSDLLLQSHQKVEQIGSTGARLLTGNFPFYEELEDKIAHLHKAESCLIYNSGYLANLGLISSLGSEKTTFLYDLEIHASMIDGMRLSAGKSIAFRHNDLDSLERKLKAAAPPIFVLAESIYSISGELSPLKEMAALCRRYNAALIVDEAHATGVRGPSGMGYVAELSLESQIFARMHTFSKALGCHGACILGSSMLKKYLINFSRPWIYTTALPFPSLLLIESAYVKLQKEANVHQRHLDELISYFRKKIGETKSYSPIQPIYISGAEKTRELSQRLRKHGLDVRAIISPTTKRGKECLRVVLHSFNQKEEIDKLAEVLA